MISKLGLVVGANVLQEYNIEFSIDENCPIGSEVGQVNTLLPVLTNPTDEIDLFNGQLIKNREIMHKIGSHSDLFSVDPRRGLIKTKSPIDAEDLCAQVRNLHVFSQKTMETELRHNFDYQNKSKYADIIICTPSGQLSVSLDVNSIQSDGSLRAVHHVFIRIYDLNDNGPKFPQIRWHKRLKEALYRQGRRIDLPRAIDIDLLAEHSRIEYRLEPWPTNHKRYNQTATTYNRDNSSIVIVDFTSHNKIGPQPFKLEIDYNQNQPRLVLTHDLDAELQTRYRFVLVAYSPYSNEYASVKAATNRDLLAEIRAVKKQQTLNREEAHLEIDIEIADMNDNEPVFVHNAYNITVPEDTKSGTMIYEVIAHDPDKTAKLSYKLSSIVHDYNLVYETFHLELDGQLILRQNLDYELCQQYNLPVEVTDGEFTANTIVNVQVIDVNDEVPKFELNPKQLIVDENAESGKLIGRLRIRDPDTAAVNGQVQCSEPIGLAGDQAIKFSPDPSADPTAGIYDLTTRSVLDRESTANPNPGQVIIYLICIDGASIDAEQQSSDTGPGPRLTATMTATVLINDVNDHAPVFDEEIYHISMRENNPTEQAVIQVHATDADLGDNARITYSLFDRTNFKVDPLSGWITAKVVFDRETRDTYQLTVIATDQGKPRASSSVLLNITVIDMNDHSPVLAPADSDQINMDSLDLPIGRLNEQNIFIVNENMPSNTYLGFLLASDLDEGINAQLKFEFVPDLVNYHHMKFKLTNNGSLFTTKELDREEKDQYRLTVMVSDASPIKPLTTTGAISIIVLDVNDNRPHLVKPKGLLIHNISQFSNYAIHSKNSPTLLHDEPSEESPQQNGVAKSTHDSKGQTDELLNSDKKSQSNKNDLPEPAIRLSVHEKPGQVIEALYAEDADTGNNGKIFYMMEEMHNSNRFNTMLHGPFIRVEPDNGNIVLLRHLLPVDLGYHFYQVTASDKGQPTMKIDKKILLLIVEDTPMTSETKTNLLSSSYYFDNIAKSNVKSWEFYINKNNFIIIILSSVSGVLVLGLITAILCATNLCGNCRIRTSTNQRPRRRANGPIYTVQDSNGLMDNHEISNVNDGQYGYCVVNGAGASQTNFGNYQPPPSGIAAGYFNNDEREGFTDDQLKREDLPFPYNQLDKEKKLEGVTNLNTIANTKRVGICTPELCSPTMGTQQPMYENLKDFHYPNDDVFVRTCCSSLKNYSHSSSMNTNDNSTQECKIPSSFALDVNPHTIRILNANLKFDLNDTTKEQILLPCSEQFYGINIGKCSNISCPSNKYLTSRCTDLTTAFCVAKPIPLVSSGSGEIESKINMYDLTSLCSHHNSLNYSTITHVNPNSQLTHGGYSESMTGIGMPASPPPNSSTNSVQCDRAPMLTMAIELSSNADALLNEAGKGIEQTKPLDNDRSISQNDEFNTSDSGQGGSDDEVSQLNKCIIRKQSSRFNTNLKLIQGGPVCR